MAFHIRDEAADRAIRTLAERRQLTLTEAVRVAAENELKRDVAQADDFMERIRAIQRQAAAYPRTGLEADKRFYDELSGDL